MQTKYKPNDVVYIVNGYKVNKAVIETVNIQIDVNGQTINYGIYDYRQKNNPQRKVVPVKEALIVNDLEVARASAKVNWKQIVEQVNYQLDTMSDKIFEPIPEEALDKIAEKVKE